MSAADLESREALAAVMKPMFPVAASIPPVAGRNLFEAQSVLRQQHTITSHERIALMAFSWLFEAVVDVVTAHAEASLQQLLTERARDGAAPAPHAMSPLAAAALDLVGVITLSEFRSVLVPFFYRPLIAKAGLRAQIIVHAVVNR